jgi:hypothetical protein
MKNACHPRRNRRNSAVFIAVAFAVGSLSVSRGATAADSSVSGQAAALPPKLLDARSGGKTALAAATAKGVLPSVAAKAGMSEAKLSDLLSRDSTVHLDEYGDIYFVEPIPVAPGSTAIEQPAVPSSASSPASPKQLDLGKPESIPTPTDQDLANATTDLAAPAPVLPAPTGPAVSAAPFPYANTFTLHSRPGALRVIYLDFNGHSVIGGVGGNSGWPTHTGPAFDIGGDPSTFTNLELDIIQSVYQRVAEDFAVFGVDVTTQDPGFDAINRSSAADIQYGTRVAIVSGGYGNLCGSCSGVAKRGAFSDDLFHSFKQPAWVFSTLNYNDPKYIAETASHEAGHNLNLEHDGCTGVLGACTAAQSEYYAGSGNWAPIMGESRNRPVSQWSKGQYIGANNTQDDLAVIAGQIPYVADTPNATFPTAANLGVLVTSGRTGAGLISNAQDVDIFRFYAPTASVIYLSASPSPVSPNADLNVVLYDGNGLPILSNNPVSGTISEDQASGLNGFIEYNLPVPGWYYASVDAAQTDSTGQVGYSYYGSVGPYLLSVSPGATPGSSFSATPSVRLLDTRSTPPVGQLAAGAIRNLTVAGVAGVPADATAVVLNVAAVNPVGNGHLRVFPAGTALPTASVLNFNTGKNTPNRVIVKVGAANQISIYAGNTTHVLVDIAGYFELDDSKQQYTPTPTPTNIGTLTVPGAVVNNPAASTVNFDVLATGGIPSYGPISAVTTVAVNVLAENPTSAGHLRVFPAGSALPSSSTNNFVAGDSRSNLVLVSPGTDGKISVYNASAGPVTVRVSTVGYFTSGGLGYRPVDPVRPLDTRAAGGVTGGQPIPTGTIDVPIRGFGPVPNSTNVSAVVVNVASVGSTGAGVLGAWKSFSGFGVVPPASLYHLAGENVANLMIVPIGSDGSIRIWNTVPVGATTHVLVDIVGYFTN